MRFLLQLAWRDSRHSRRRLAVSALAIVLGIAALVAIGSFADNLRKMMESQSKSLLGSDLSATINGVFPVEFTHRLESLGARKTETVLFNSMLVLPGQSGATRLVQVRAMEPAFPFYGSFETQPAFAAAQLQEGDNAILEEALMVQFGIKVGDIIRLGHVDFKVLGALRKIPGESIAIAFLSPRVFIPRHSLERTGLAGPGSLIRYRADLQLPAGRDADAEVRILRRDFAELHVHFDTVADRTQQIGRSLANVDSFMSLVGYVAMVLGAVGVASAMHIYIREKLPSIAVLRCLGASSKQAFTVYLLQGLALGCFGSVLGVALGLVFQALLPRLAAGLLPDDLPWSVSWPSVLGGLGAGISFCFLFTLLPLLEIRRISPLSALRSAFSSESRKIDPWRIVLGITLGLAFIGYAVVLARSLRTGVAIAAGLAIGLAVLVVAARLLAWSARRFCPAFLPYPIRQGIASLHRPENRTVLLLLALGLGTFLVVTIDLARSTLLQGIAGSADRSGANLIFMDVQDDQVEGLRGLLSAAGTPVKVEAPIVTMRISRIKGRAMRDIVRDPTARVARWALNHEYRSTYRSQIRPSETLVSGKWEGRVTPGTEIVPISLEQGQAANLGVKLGDELEFDVQGVPLKARIASLREVDWKRLEPNFFIVFPEGVLEAAPKFFVVAVQTLSASDSARLQRAVVAAYPNVSAIDLTLVFDTLDGIFGKLELVVRALALITGGTGILVLAGSMLAGRYQRIRESVLLRTLGCSRRQLILIQGSEYAILGILAALLGCCLAAVANALMARYMFRIPAAWPWSTFVIAVGSVGLLTLFAGWYSNRDVVNHPPLAVLRQES